MMRSILICLGPAPIATEISDQGEVAKLYGFT